jgi:CheY-like chemotaxis protein
MPRILFVDDNIDFLDICTPVLNKAGYDVITAENGVEAINKFNESSFDVVVTDVVMPGANGYELAKHIRDKSNGAIPAVIGITGTSWGINLSCFDIVLQKPFSIKILIECLRAFENKRN